MKIVQMCHTLNSASSATTDLKAKGSRVSAYTTSEAVVADLAELVRDLHELLESYAPMWYTKTTDDRVREKLAVAVGALQTSGERCGSLNQSAR